MTIGGSQGPAEAGSHQAATLLPPSCSSASSSGTPGRAGTSMAGKGSLPTLAYCQSSIGYI